MSKEIQKTAEKAESLLHEIDDFLEKALEKEEDLEKAKALEGKETKEEEKLEEESKKSMTSKAGDEEDEDNADEDEKEEEIKKKAKKCAVKAKKSNDEEEVEKSFKETEEYKEYMTLKKAKEDDELRKAQQEKEELKKSITDLTSLVSNMKSQMEEIKKQPAAMPRSVDGLSVLEKANPSGVKLTEEGLVDNSNEVPNMPKKLFKAKVANVMFEKGVQELKKLAITDIAEYEATGYLMDPSKRKFVKSLVDAAIKDGSF